MNLNGHGLSKFTPIPMSEKTRPRERRPEKGPVVAEHAAINHEEIKIAE